MTKAKKKAKRTSRTTFVLFALAIALLVTSAVGGTYAALRYRSKNYDARITVHDIGVTLMENGQPVGWRNYTGSNNVWDEQTGTLLSNMLDGDRELELGKHYPEELYVTNTGAIDEYVRVRVFKYWEDAEGNKLTNLDPDNIELDLQGEGWYENPEEKTTERSVLYYTTPLAPGEATTSFLHAVTIKTAVCNQVTETTYVDDYGYKVIETVYHYDGAKFVVKAQVDAVQTHNAEDAILSAWGVAVQMKDGVLSFE